MSGKPWIGVDLDGTIAEYHGWTAPDHIGPPIAEMVQRVKEWIDAGLDVRIFTARGSIDEQDRALAYPAITRWCEQHLGQALPITNVKDIHMVALWDDRAVQVLRNVGLPVETMTQRAVEVVAINRANGWNVTKPEDWEGSEHKVPAILALIHSEVSEALEDFRHGRRDHFGEELADVVIRVLDLAGGLGIDIEAAVRAKLTKNRTRGLCHGGKRV